MMPPVTARTFPDLSLPSSLSSCFSPGAFAPGFTRKVSAPAPDHWRVTPFLAWLGSTVLSMCLPPVQSSPCPQGAHLQEPMAPGPPAVAGVCAELPRGGWKHSLKLSWGLPCMGTGCDWGVPRLREGRPEVESS